MHGVGDGFGIKYGAGVELVVGVVVSIGVGAGVRSSAEVGGMVETGVDGDSATGGFLAQPARKRQTIMNDTPIHLFILIIIPHFTFYRIILPLNSCLNKYIP